MMTLHCPKLMNASMGTFVLLLTVGQAYSAPISIQLGAADPFAILAGASITNTGTSTIAGRLGVAPGTAFAGFPFGQQPADLNTAMAAQAALSSAYGVAAGAACSKDLSGKDLGGMVLTPGVYCFSSSAQLTGSVILDGQGDSQAMFVFQIVSALTTASGSSVEFSNSSQARGVFWQVGSSATLGTATMFAGNLLALTSITLDTGAAIQCGRALAMNGSVTLDSNTVSNAGCEAGTTGGGDVVAPEPGTWLLVVAGLGFVVVSRREIGSAV